jgi:hypothetical protein
VRAYGSAWLAELPNWFGGRARKEQYIDQMVTLGFAILYEELAFSWWWLDEANDARKLTLCDPVVRANLTFFRSCVNALNCRDPATLELLDPNDSFAYLTGSPFLKVFGNRRGALSGREIAIVSLFSNYLHSLWVSFNNEMAPYLVAPSAEMYAQYAVTASRIDADIF